MHDACACALFSVIVASIAGATYAVALRKWRRARSSSLVSPPSVIAARYRKSNSHATRPKLSAAGGPIFGKIIRPHRPKVAAFGGSWGELKGFEVRLEDLRVVVFLGLHGVEERRFTLADSVA